MGVDLFKLNNKRDPGKSERAPKGKKKKGQVFKTMIKNTAVNQT